VRRYIPAVLVAAVLIGGAPADAATPGVAADVIDGDLLRVRPAGATRTITVRLPGVDAPRGAETGRYSLVGVVGPASGDCGGKRARAALLELAFSAPVDSDGDGSVDRPGGRARFVRLGEVVRVGGVDAAAHQVRLGNARTVRDKRLSASRLRPLLAAQASARRRRAGVWGRCDGDFARPSLYDSARFVLPSGPFPGSNRATLVTARPIGRGRDAHVYFIGGMTPECDQLDRVEVRYGERRISLTVFLGGPETGVMCPFLGLLAATTVHLDQPIGDRRLVDGCCRGLPPPEGLP
jgi:endonuclease YncB( thermonuclease family)